MPRTKSIDGVPKVGPRLVTKSVRVKSSQSSAISHDQIAFRAYELFLQEGGGDDVSHWLRAERELLAAQAAVPAKKVAGARAKR
jgi:hypothetical protein